ncbi:unnamed protein product [Protopolystoma xenopodis]|uniref:Uncharacterized protein n=1 Tax=Protopolystoma xenopodis TaxID=117903 RepID=A0A448XC13_9PLAT|nr:unnamed protein product [Protopolystoma xenopodis]
MIPHRLPPSTLLSFICFVRDSLPSKFASLFSHVPLFFTTCTRRITFEPKRNAIRDTDWKFSARLGLV